MLVYIWDNDTKEYLYCQECDSDPEETLIKGEFVPLLPANSTLILPPSIKDGFAIVWNEGWEYVEDHRGVKLFDKTTQTIIEQTVLGPIDENCVPLDEYQKSDEYLAKQEEDAKRAIAMLNMTKYDFYKLICVPNGIKYFTLMDIINQDEEVCAAWNLCERVYRGDELLTSLVKQYIPSMTDERLTEIFKEVHSS